MTGGGGADPGGRDAARGFAQIVNQRGLHARAAVRFVRVSEQFDAAVTVLANSHTVSGGSIMGLLMLAASPGTKLELEAEGPEAADAIVALVELIGRGFDEE